jgi:hypothetical protein
MAAGGRGGGAHQQDVRARGGWSGGAGGSLGCAVLPLPCSPRRRRRRGAALTSVLGGGHQHLGAPGAEGGAGVAARGRHLKRHPKTRPKAPPPEAASTEALPPQPALQPPTPPPSPLVVPEVGVVVSLWVGPKPGVVALQGGRVVVEHAHRVGEAWRRGGGAGPGARGVGRGAGARLEGRGRGQGQGAGAGGRGRGQGRQPASTPSTRGAPGAGPAPAARGPPSRSASASSRPPAASSPSSASPPLGPRRAMWRHATRIGKAGNSPLPLSM